MRALGEAGLQDQALALRLALRRQGLQPALVGQSFALVREAAGRSLGKRHYPTQLMAGWGLVRGELVEMATGEGKTLSATLAAATMALAGQPVHVITVNDYLAQRDAHEMGPLYRRLGLRVGTVLQGMAPDARRSAYACDITYCSNKELAFDYLRDRVAVQGRGSPLHRALDGLQAGAVLPAASTAASLGLGGSLVLRGLGFAIVDEADSVFIDEARTPLILSASQDDPAEAAASNEALALARSLLPGVDFVLDRFQHSVRLQDAGRDRIAERAAGRPGWWASARAREERINQALCALLLYQRDQHYLVADGKVQIVDESTGRVMPDRSWERGLHQMIEAKEGVALSAQRVTLARLTYQRLMRRYLRLSGITGTAVEVAGEILAVYRLAVQRVPLARPARRQVLAPLVCRSAADKWQRVADSAQQIAQQADRPVLIGTRSVEASEQISALLTARGVPHALLNAKQDQGEAEVVAAAGQPGRVTVATNLAGRGTDILLGPGVAERGGLHVILTEHHDSPRIDRQLQGRCARQGDPGSCQAVVALDDALYRVCTPRLARWLAHWMGRRGSLPQPAYRLLTWLAQHAAETRHARLRRQTLLMDQRLHKMLAFTGQGE